MKVWYGYGSEHSANLVMIGHFKDAGGALKAKNVIDELIRQASADSEKGPGATDRFTDEMLDLLRSIQVHSLGPAEIEQFTYDVAVRVDKSKVVVTTDEIDISAFLKVLFDQGARIEIYSAHEHPGTGYGRGEKA
jgi:hypothetical protein